MSGPFDSQTSHFEGSLDFANFYSDLEPLLFSGVNLPDFREAHISPCDSFDVISHLPTPSPQTPTKYMSDDMLPNRGDYHSEPITREFTHFWRGSPLPSPPESSYEQEGESFVYSAYGDKLAPFSMEDPLILENITTMPYMDPLQTCSVTSGRNLCYDDRLSQKGGNSQLDSCVSPNDLESLPITPYIKNTPEDDHKKSSSLIVEQYNLSQKSAPESPKRSRGRKASTKQETQGSNKTFSCDYKGCGKVFKRAEHLKRHIRSIHTLEKPFPCPHPTCTKRFSRSDNLNQHVRVHRNSRDRTTNPNFNHFTPYVPSSTSPETFQSVFLN